MKSFVKVDFYNAKWCDVLLIVLSDISKSIYAYITFNLKYFSILFLTIPSILEILNRTKFYSYHLF